METTSGDNRKKAKKSCWDFEIWQEDNCAGFWGCVCVATLIIWPMCLGFALYFLDDSNLTSSSLAFCVDIDPDQRCCSYADEHECDGYQYEYQWVVFDSLSNDQCENVTFSSLSFCYTSKREQTESGPDRILGENATWYHDQSCDDWSINTPQENENIGIYLIYICIASAVIYVISTYILWKLCFGDVGK